MKILKYSYDFEFLERGHEFPIEAISLGVKCEDGRSYYAVFDDFSFVAALNHPFVGEAVMPYIPMVTGRYNSPTIDLEHPDVKGRRVIKRELEEFYGLEQGMSPELWGYYADYDHVLHSQIWGVMVDLPEGMPMYTRDIKQEMDRQGVTSEDFYNEVNSSAIEPVQNARIPHHALHDAESQLEMLTWLLTR
jgi:hypothetical protein